MSEKILIVDDDPQYLKTLMTAFELSGFKNEVAVAHNGAEALDFLYNTDGGANLVKNIPSVIFLDINMPKMDGFQALLTIRDIKETQAIPIIMLTGSSDNEDRSRSMKLGATGYLVKPVDIADLLSIVRNYIK